MAFNQSQSVVPDEGADDSSDAFARPYPMNLSVREEHLYTNHFTCSLSDGVLLYQYDVTAEEMNEASGEWRECESRLQCLVVAQSIIVRNQWDAKVFVWYDDQKHLYSTSRLQPQTRSTGNGRSRLTIQSLSGQWSTVDISDYIQGRTTTYPHDAVRIIEVLLKNSLQDRVRMVKGKFYFLNKPAVALGNGFERRQAFVQALNLSSNLLTLNIESKTMSMYCNVSLLTFVHQQTRSNRMPSDRDYENLNRVLQNCVIFIQQSGWKEEYVFDKFDYRRAYEIELAFGQTLTDYYQEKKNITLTQTNYPCVQVYRRIGHRTALHLPLEVCMIKKWQVYDELFLEAQQGNTYILTPEERYHAITEALHDCDYNSSSLCQAIGFSVDTEEMVELDARVLPLPSIKLGSRHKAAIDEGRMFHGENICVPKSISRLAITYFGTRALERTADFNKFTDQLVNTMEGYNLYHAHEEHFVEPVFEDIDAYFQLMTKRNCEFMVCAMDVEGAKALSELRSSIKTCGTMRHGIMTQCLIFSDIPVDESALRNYYQGLAQKINFKNGGINKIVDLSTVLGAKKSPDDFYMFFGATVRRTAYVTRQHPSIAAIIGSTNPACSTVAVRVSKQYPRQGTSSLEHIVGLKEMVKELLDYYHQTNGNWPTKVVFYREGTDEDQCRKIQEFEVPAIRLAFDEICGERNKRPLLTVIGVRKRHNTRFFTYNPDVASHDPKRLVQETDNMTIGSVISTTIVHPYEHDFYLNSHNTDRGVNHPSLYHVLLDEIGFTDDELQVLTYHLCWTDPRSSVAEAIPSVIHQAEVAATNARDLFESNEEASTAESNKRSPPPQNLAVDDFDYEILHVHQKLQNKPVLI